LSFEDFEHVAACVAHLQTRIAAERAAPLVYVSPADLDPAERKKFLDEWEKLRPPSVGRARPAASEIPLPAEPGSPAEPDALQ
jgi:hypothetical protein